MRMLQRAENRNNKNNGNSKKDKGDTSGQGRGQGNKGGYGGKREIEKHSAHLDTNDAGITTDKIEYTYGEEINISFDLTNDLVADEVLATLDVSTMSEWKIGCYMRMADPQGGLLEPIVSVTPTITENVDVGRMLLQEAQEEPPRQQKRLRGLQDVTTEPTVVPDPDVPQDDEDVLTEDEPQGPPPTLNYVGTAILTTTDIDTLDPTIYGNGFDCHIIDQNGAAIIGPATFYELKTPEMLAADEAKASQKAKVNGQKGLMKFNHAKVKKQYGKGGSSKGGAKGAAAKFGITSKSMGMGSGVDGGQILSTAEALATYVLETDALVYALGDDVIVTYDLSPDVVEDARRLQNNGNGGGNGNGNKNKPDVVEPEVVETTTSSTTSTGGGVDETSPPTTTAPPEPEIDMSAGDNDMVVPAEIDPDDLHLYSMGIYMRMVRFCCCCCCCMYTCFSFGLALCPYCIRHLYMYLIHSSFLSLSYLIQQANPQGGDLPPIIDMPFCTTEEDCAGKTIDDLKAGTFTLSTNDLDTTEYGTGYDVWVLNGLGHGVAGPYTFYIE